MKSFNQICFVIAGLAVAACSSSATLTPDAGELPRDAAVPLLPSTHSLGMTLSDMPGDQFVGHGGLEISSAPFADDDLRATLHLSSWLESNGLSVGLTAQISKAQVASLASGARTTLGIPGFAPVGIVLEHRNGSRFERRLLAATLTFESNTAVFTFELGEQSSPATPVENSEPASTMIIRGQYPVLCALVNSGDVTEDPMWTSEFCQTTRTELGLGAWIDAMM